MSHFGAALWAEALKARRSRVAILTALGFSLAPLMGGLFMFILKDPARARSIGIVSAKAQLVAGRGYLPALGWVMLSLFLAQVVAATGRGDWFPWSVPALYAGLAGPRTSQLGLHSFVVAAATLIAGLVATLLWWQRADQDR